MANHTGHFKLERGIMQTAADLSNQGDWDPQMSLDRLC